MTVAWIYLLYAVAAVIGLYRLAKAKNANDIALPIILLLFGALLFNYEMPGDVLRLLSGLVIFDGLMFSYGKKLNYAYFAACAAYIILFRELGVAHIAQAMLLGLLGETHLLNGKSLNPRGKKSVETKRDFIQIGIGVVLIAILFFVAKAHAYEIILGLVLLGFLAGNYAASSKNNPLAKRLFKFERDYTTFGHGAIWLAMGSLAAIGFLQPLQVIAVFACLFVGDSLATIVGINYGKTRLPYNDKKSVIGAVAYFLSSFLIAYLFIGVLALAVALLAALVESLPKHIDDNFDVAIVLTLFFVALSVV